MPMRWEILWAVLPSIGSWFVNIPIIREVLYGILSIRVLSGLMKIQELHLPMAVVIMNMTPPMEISIVMALLLQTELFTLLLMRSVISIEIYTPLWWIL